MPLSTDPEQAVSFIPKLIASGSDHIEFLIEDGSTASAPGLPMLDQATLNAGVAGARRLGMMTLTHTLTVRATRTALEAGIDGLAHLFVDEAQTPEIIDLVASAGVFVVPCIHRGEQHRGVSHGSNCAGGEPPRHCDDRRRVRLETSFARRGTQRDHGSDGAAGAPCARCLLCEAVEPIAQECALVRGQGCRLGDLVPELHGGS